MQKERLENSSKEIPDFDRTCRRWWWNQKHVVTLRDSVVKSRSLGEAWWASLWFTWVRMGSKGTVRYEFKWKRKTG